MESKPAEELIKLQISIPPNTAAKIRLASELLKISEDEVVRRAIDAYGTDSKPNPTG